MGEKPQKATNFIARFIELVTDLKVIVTAVIALGAGGSAMHVLGDAGVTKADVKLIADSVVTKRIAPLDTAMMRIFFRQDVMMSDIQKEKADSLMRAALRNINYGGAQ